MSLLPFSGQARAHFCIVLWSVLILVGMPGRVAAAPVNDTCAGAVTIPSSGPFPFFCPVMDVMSATSVGEPETTLTNGLCSAPVSRGIWFKFRPSAGGFYTLTTCSPGSTVDDTVMAVYSSAGGCGGPFVQLECNDDALGTCNLLSLSTVALLADTDYYVVVWLYDTEAPVAGKSSVQLVVTRETPPLNDTCLTAMPLFLNTPVTGSTVLGSNNYRLSGTGPFTGTGQRAAAGIGRDVVYRFLAPEAGDYSFKASAYKDDTDFDLMLYIGGYCAPGVGAQTLTNVIAAANRNHVGTAEEVMCVPLTNGQLVYVYLDDTNFNSGSTFILEVTQCVRETEPNNTPATATRLAFGIEGSIVPAGDYDFYAVGNFPPGWRLFAMVIGDAANTPPDFQMRVTTLDQTLEYDDNDNDPRFGQTSPNIAGTPLPGGPAFISVNGAGQLEPYQLYAVVQPPTNWASVEIEPNNTIAQANSSPANYFYGKLAGPAPSTDEDIYRFTALDGDLVFVSLDEDPTRDGTALNAQLELLDEFGNSLMLVNDGRSSSDTSRTTNNLYAGNPDFPGEALVYRCPEGIYYVRVSIGTTIAGPSGAGDYLLSISRNGIPGDTGLNTAPVLQGIGATSPVVEGDMASLAGSVFDPDLGDSAVLQIDWGDGSSETLNFNVPGLNAFALQHAYVDDAPTGTPADSFTITMTATDSHGQAARATLPVLVTNAAPKLVNVTVTSPVYANSNAVVSGMIEDPGLLDTFQLAVNWGDGSAVQNFNYPLGVRAFAESHAYAAGNTNYSIQLNLTDDDTGVGTAGVLVQVKLFPAAGRFLGPTRSADGHVQLRLEATPGATYRILASQDLLTWTEVGSATADNGGALAYEDPAPASMGSRFYRALVLP